MEKELTERAKNLLSARSKIEGWCNENLCENSFKIFVLYQTNDYNGGDAFVYSATHKKIFLFTAGGNDIWQLKTGMCEYDFERFLKNKDFSGPHLREIERTNNDGNLIFDSKVYSLICGWPSEKKRLSKFIENDKSLKDFKA